jgi:hypothetical protein
MLRIDEVTRNSDYPHVEALQKRMCNSMSKQSRGSTMPTHQWTSHRSSENEDILHGAQREML